MGSSFNSFENGLTRYIEKDFLLYIQKQCIGIIGSGGLGSNILNVLVRTGFKNFIIADFDKVDISNLNRQLYTLEDVGEYKTLAITRYVKKINEDLDIECVNKTINKNNIKQIFEHCNIIFEAVDKAESKKDIYTTLYKEDKILIFGNGLGGISLINSKEIKIKKVKENIYIVGDNESEVNNTTNPYAPKVIAVASLMAGVLFDLIYKKYREEIK